jgi:hypothetical protein
MTREDRIKHYVKGLKYKTVDGIYRLTPAQRRRLRHKQNHTVVKAGEGSFDPGGWKTS